VYNSGTRTIKIFLHLSQQEQQSRFIARIDNPDKTGNLLTPIFKKESFGQNIKRLIKSVYVQQVPAITLGMLCQPLIKKCTLSCCPNRV
jgi:hypothetical protein